MYIAECSQTCTAQQLAPKPATRSRLPSQIGSSHDTTSSSGKWISLQVCCVASAGQYGHLKVRSWLLAILLIVVLASTCPQGSIFGGLPGVLCSLDTGHANVLWKMNSLPSSRSTVNCGAVLNSCCCWPLTLEASFSSVGSATEPAATHTNKGLS